MNPRGAEDALSRGARQAPPKPRRRYALRRPRNPDYPRTAQLLDTSRRKDPGGGAWSKKPVASACFGVDRCVHRTEDALISSAPCRVPPRSAAVRKRRPLVEPSIYAAPRRETHTVGPRCLPLEIPVSRSTYPQPVPSLWIRGVRPLDSRLKLRFTTTQLVAWTGLALARLADPGAL